MKKIGKFLLVLVAADVTRYGVTVWLKRQSVKVEAARRAAQESTP